MYEGPSADDLVEQRQTIRRGLCCLGAIVLFVMAGIVISWLALVQV
jgi:hypothetical protein